MTFTPDADSPAESGRWPLRQIIPGVFAPCLIYETGIGAVIPVIPLQAGRLSGAVTVGAVVVTLLGLGRLIGDVPAGKMAARFGDRRAMLWAAAISIVVEGTCALAQNWVILAAAVLLLGGLDSVFLLARQSYLAQHTPPLKRARAMSTLGGVGRMGMLIGPFLGSAVIQRWDLRAVFWMSASIALVVLIVLLIVPKLGGDKPPVPETKIALGSIVRQHRHLLLQLGAAILIVGAVRAVRNTALPLWGEQIGLSDARTSLVFGLSGLVDAAFFYPGGRAMDRHGRAWVAVPSMVIMGLCLMILPLTHSLTSFTIVAMTIGLGNALGSGIVMTLGADLAPPAQRAQFLGVWRLINDVGTAAGPLVVSAGAALGSIGFGIAIIGGTGLGGAACFGVWLPRWTVHANHTTRKAAGLESPG